MGATVVDCLLKATKVDGVYDSDPVKNPDAHRFDKISYMEVLARELRGYEEYRQKVRWRLVPFVW